MFDIFQCMSITLRVDSGEGRAVIVKSASADSAQRLAQEAARLVAAAHPGVVEVTATGPVGEGWELRLAHGGRPLASVRTLSTRAIAKVVSSVATTLADLHAMGVVHGRVDASHVLLGPDGRGVLCGLGPDVADPAPTPADDVAALGCLLAELLGDHAEGEPIPDRRWARRRPSVDHERRALLAIADHACADIPTRRPTARRLAASMSAVAPWSTGGQGASDEPRGAGVASRQGEVDDDPMSRLRRSVVDPPARHRPARVVVLGGVGAVLLGIAGMRSMAPDELDARSSPPEPERAAAPSSTVSKPASPPPSSPPVDPTGALDVDGRVVTFEGRRYEVGEPGDLVVVGDWDCDGTPTPAVLRPRSGEVFAFDSWGSGEPVEVAPISQVSSAEALVTTPGAGGCTALAVRMADQRLVEIVSAPRAA